MKTHAHSQSAAGPECDHSRAPRGNLRAAWEGKKGRKERGGLKPMSETAVRRPSRPSTMTSSGRCCGSTPPRALLGLRNLPPFPSPSPRGGRGGLGCCCLGCQPFQLQPPTRASGVKSGRVSLRTVSTPPRTAPGTPHSGRSSTPRTVLALQQTPQTVNRGLAGA